MIKHLLILVISVAISAVTRMAAQGQESENWKASINTTVALDPKLWVPNGNTNFINFAPITTKLEIYSNGKVAMEINKDSLLFFCRDGRSIELDRNDGKLIIPDGIQRDEATAAIWRGVVQLLRYYDEQAIK